MYTHPEEPVGPKKCWDISPLDNSWPELIFPKGGKNDFEFQATIDLFWEDLPHRFVAPTKVLFQLCPVEFDQTGCYLSQSAGRWLFWRTSVTRACKILLCCLVLLLFTASAFTVRAQDGQWEEAVGSVIYSTALSGDGSIQVVGTRTDGVRAYHAQGNLLWEFFPESTVWGIDTSEDGQWTAVASEDRHLYLLDGEGQEVWSYRSSRIFLDVAISRDGSRIFAVDEGRTAYFLDRENGEPIWTATLRDISDTVAIYGSETIRPLVGTRGAQVNLYSPDGQQLWSAQLDQDLVSIDVNRNGAKVIAGTLDGKVTLINGATSEILWQIDLPTPPRCTARNRSNCLNVSIAGDGGRVLVGTKNGDLYLLNGADGNVLQQYSLDGIPSSVAIALDGEAWLVGTTEGVVLSTSTSEATAVSQALQASRRNLFIGILSIGGLVIAILALWIRRTDGGQAAWISVSTPVRDVGVQMWRSRISYILLLPTFIFLFVFNYYPAASGLYHSFTEWKPGIETTWVGLGQFREMFDSPYFWGGMQNALILVLAACIKLLFPLIVAELIFNVWHSALQYVLRTLFIVPLVLPSVVGILLWVNIYDPNIGLLNKSLEALGLEQLTRVWLGDRNTAMGSIVAIGFPWINPFALLIFYGGLISIPKELFDAAKVDGANWWRRIIRIDLPLLMSQTKLLLILAFIGSMQEFQLIFLTTAGGPGSSTYTPALELYYNATRFTNFGLASAMGTFLFLIILVGTMINLRYIRSQTEYEA
ncbi:PQQ-binding-like beta-propeller repeat protein [Chloroflexi bacterium TSY]|nr:PQQ-binding-like beta-propeller repeat protein [Chloroflexi bacterium TSY]